MAMRYVIRRSKVDEYAEIKREVSNLDDQLGHPAENMRRPIRVQFSPMRHVVYTFVSRKKGDAWIWVCPSLEMVAEDEAGLFALTEHFHVPKPTHLAHVPGSV